MRLDPNLTLRKFCERLHTDNHPWFPNCHKENPLLVTTYKKYKEKNFKMLGISLDKRKAAWLAATEEDQLDWTHVLVYKVWQADVENSCHSLAANRLFN